MKIFLFFVDKPNLIRYIEIVNKKAPTRLKMIRMLIRNLMIPDGKKRLSIQSIEARQTASLSFFER